MNVKKIGSYAWSYALVPFMCLLGAAELFVLSVFLFGSSSLKIATVIKLLTVGQLILG